MFYELYTTRDRTKISTILQDGNVSKEQKRGWIKIRDYQILRLAVASGAPFELVKLIVELGDRDAVLGIDENNNENALYFACRNGSSMEIVKLLLDVGGKDAVLGFDRKKWNSLHAACFRNALSNRACPEGGLSADIVQHLLDVGGSDAVLATEENMSNCLNFACKVDAPVDVIRLLADVGGKEAVLAGDEYDWTSLHFAISNMASIDVIQLLVQIGGREAVLASDNKQRNSLHLACEIGAQLDVVKLLVNAGGREAIIATENMRNNCLHIACSCGASLDVVRLLVYVGGRDIICAKNKIAASPLHSACTNSASHDVVRLLVEIGGKEAVHAKTNTKCNPLHCACMEGAPLNIIRTLTSAGGKEVVLHQNLDGDTPLHQTCHRDQHGVVKHLIEIGGIELIEKVNKDNNNALQVYYSESPLFVQPILFLQDKLLELQHWVAFQSIATEQAISWASTLPPDSQEEAVKGHFMKIIVNETFSKPQIFFVLIADLYVQIYLVVFFSFGIEEGILDGSNHLNNRLRLVLMLCIFWLIFREALQILTTPLSHYIKEVSNWLDLIQIALVCYCTAFLSKTGITNTGQGTLVTLSVGMTWLLLIYAAKNMFYSIAVFVVALQKILHQIIPFLFTTLLVILGFSHMFYVAISMDPISCPVLTNGNKMNHWEHYFNVFTAILGSAWNCLESPSSGTTVAISFIFAAITGILLLNVLIAVITNVFTDVRENGRTAFWTNRLRLVAGLMAISQALHGCNRKLRKLNEGTEANSSIDDEIGRLSFTSCTRKYEEIFLHDIEGREFFMWWFNLNHPFESHPARPNLKTRARYFLKYALLHQILLPGREFECILLGVQIVDRPKASMHLFFIRIMSYIMFLVVTPILVLIISIAGIVTFGYLWPNEFMKYVFLGSINDNKDVLDEKLDQVTSTGQKERYSDIDDMILGELNSAITNLKEEFRTEFANIKIKFEDEHATLSKEVVNLKNEVMIMKTNFNNLDRKIDNNFEDIKMFMESLRH